MDKIKCPYGCKVEQFMLISEKKYPTVVNSKGEIVSGRTYMYKCTACSTIFSSDIGPDNPKKKLLNE